MSPVHIGNYRIGRTLGVGSFGKVKLAEHERTGKKCAVKIHNRQKIRAQQLEEKVKREIKILKMCMHPHIIRLYEVIETPTDVYVFIEYSSGGELFDYIVERGRLLETEARRFFQQLLSGVEYCHKNMIAHRDLKPENLLLDERCNVKIADFGLSNCMRDGWFLKTSCGSPNYAAPEVISGKLYAGPEVDIWSCGVILYALLCGTLPFDDESIPYLFKKIKGGIYILPSYLSDDSRDLISKMLVTDPLKRITIDEIRSHPWFRRDLPRYLDRPIKVGVDMLDVKMDLVETIARKMDYPTDKLLRALRKGKRNHLTAGYHLVKDSLDKEMFAQQKSSDEGTVMDFTSIVTTNGYPFTAAPTPTSTTTTPTLPTATSPMMRSDVYCTQQTAREWIAGVRCRHMGTANDAMMEMYRALNELKWKWKTPPQCSFQIRVVVDRAEFDKPVRFALQLYKAPGCYYMDVQRLDGDILAYFAVCSELLRVLRF